ncbi:MAG TPA: ABC transporter ATP-binding protein [Bacillales bacterium]|nr:ABC transporter ATP-binding protein [Bacillales bacterium]
METFKRLKQYYLPYKRYFFGSMFFLMIVTAITVLYPVVLQLAIDKGIKADHYEWIPYLAIGFVVIMMLKGFTAYLQSYWVNLFSIGAIYELRQGLYKKLQYLPFRFYDNAHTGDLMSRLTADVMGFGNFLAFGFSQLFRFVLMVGFSLVIMFSYSWELALITLLMTPFLAVTVYQFDKRVHPAFRKVRRSLASLNTRVQENVSGVNTVKALSQEDFEIERFGSQNYRYKENYLFTSGLWAKYFPFMELIGDLTVVLLLGFGGWQVAHGTLSPGALVAFFSLVWYIMDPVIELGFIINAYSQAKASGERLLEILDEPEDIQTLPQAIKKERLDGRVTFDHVSLQYPNENTYALKDVDFEAKPGQVIGLMGATGAGKSTITQLIARFYEATEGKVLIDGKDIRDHSLKTLRENLGFVLQETFLFSTSIRDNIAYGDPGASMERIIDAAKRAQAHEFITSFPKGYDTMLGERGMGLSGGQKQRIAIARALLVNPSILILDDATSAVDMQTEFKIQRAFRELMRGRTTFIIAHRISSVQHADEILVLEDGTIAERGTHEQLLQNEGLYKRIYDIQYRDRQDVMQNQRVNQQR